jgi:hypothetical protein
MAQGPEENTVSVMVSAQNRDLGREGSGPWFQPSEVRPDFPFGSPLIPELEYDRAVHGRSGLGA